VTELAINRAGLCEGAERVRGFGCADPERLEEHGGDGGKAAGDGGAEEKTSCVGVGGAGDLGIKRRSW